MEDSTPASIVQEREYDTKSLQQRGKKKELITAYGYIAACYHTDWPQKTNLKTMEKVITMQYVIRENYYFM